MRRLLTLLVLLAAHAAPSAQVLPDATTLATGNVFADTSTAALRIEHVRLDLAHAELRAVSLLRRLRPSVNVFASLSTRGRIFPAVSSQGYDPAYSQLASWPGDTWGLTASWSLDRVLDRAPVHRARAAVAQASARVDLVHARRAQADARHAEQIARRREQDARHRAQQQKAERRAELAAAELRIEAGFLARRLVAQRELLDLAEMKYRQGDLGYEALARQRLAVLGAEHAHATNAARLATAEAGETPTWTAQAPSDD